MRIEKARQPRGTIREKVRRAASAVSTWVFFSVLLATMFTIPTIEWVPLGARFVPSIMAAGALGLLTGVIVTAKFERKKPVEHQSFKWPFSRKATAILAVAGLLVIPAMPLSGMVEREFKEWRNSGKAEEAKRRFAVTSYLGNGPEFETEAVNQTLWELEDSYQRLQDNWTLPQDVSKIRVSLFRNLGEYQLRMGKDYVVGHASCPDEYGPEVAVPLEEAPSASRNDSLSQTPMHEMVHGMMCQSLGETRFYSVPRWFLEGMAEWYETEGMDPARFLLRAEKRARLWFNKNNLTEPYIFCALRFNSRDGAERRTFYETSREFVNSLESSHGIDSLNRLVDDVGAGATFEESIEKRFGGNCEELYTLWMNSF